MQVTDAAREPRPKTAADVSASGASSMLRCYVRGVAAFTDTRQNGWHGSNSLRPSMADKVAALSMSCAGEHESGARLLTAIRVPQVKSMAELAGGAAWIARDTLNLAGLPSIALTCESGPDVAKEVPASRGFAELVNADFVHQLRCSAVERA